MKKPLDQLRGKIDALDAKIVQLINERAKVVGEIAKVKRANNAQIYVPEREKAVYDKVKDLSKGPFPQEALLAVYRELMSGSLALERRLRISYLGPDASFTHQAARLKFGSSVEYGAVLGIDSVFEEVTAGRADYGVAPIENSTEGSISDTLDMLIESPLKICGEILLGVHHNLMAACTREEIKKVYSKGQAIAQCKAWLASNLPNVELVDVGSTTQAAQLAKNERGAAAIAHEEAARIYGLEILGNRIEDSPHNSTRFVVLSRTYPGRTGADKSSIMCSIKNRPGALVDILLPFKDRDINLTQVVPWPSKKRAWDYYFFIDFEGHCQDDHVASAVRRVEELCAELRILGSYPRASQIA
jgi:chorismate mutase/prephenate dehydratase